MKINDWRAEIDCIDDELVTLLNRRARLAVEVGLLKRASGLPLYDAEREASILRRACATSEGPLDEDAIRRLFRRIIRETRRAEAQGVTAQSQKACVQAEDGLPHEQPSL